MMASKVSNAINKAKYKVDKCDPCFPVEAISVMENMSTTLATEQQKLCLPMEQILQQI